MPSIESLEKLLAEVDAEIAETHDAIIKAQVFREAVAQQIRELKSKGLSRTLKKGTLGVPRMEAETASRGAKVSIARTKSASPFRAALHKRNLSLPEWARAQKGITVEAAKSWLKAPSGGGRPIPMLWAERIAKEFLDSETGASEVPAVDASWPNGIR